MGFQVEKLSPPAKGGADRELKLLYMIDAQGSLILGRDKLFEVTLQFVCWDEGFLRLVTGG